MFHTKRRVHLEEWQRKEIAERCFNGEKAEALAAEYGCSSSYPVMLMKRHINKKVYRPVTQGEKNMAKLIEKLLPSSVDWLVDKGYIERDTEDGEPVIRITVQGYKYLAQFKRRA